MGTQSLTYVISDEKPVFCMYRHYDGYLEGHGQEIAKFLKIEGLLGDPAPKNFFMEETAAKFICFFKNQYPEGNIYLEPCDFFQETEFVYIISYSTIEVRNFDKKIFEGTFSEFYLYCHPEKKELQEEIKLIEQQKEELQNKIRILKDNLYQ